MYNCKNIKIMKGELFGNLILVVVLSAEGQWVRLTVCIKLDASLSSPFAQSFLHVSLCIVDRESFPCVSVPDSMSVCCILQYSHF
jgi:hypothetical protein